MIEVNDATTLGEAFLAATAAFGDRPLLATPANPTREYLPGGEERTYGQLREAVASAAERYVAAGYGHGHRVALMLDNRPGHFVHKLALNSLGVCVVPVNPEYRASEIAYLIDHSRVDLVVHLPSRAAQLAAGLERAAHRPAVVASDAAAMPRAGRPSLDTPVTSDTIASILYTSGTTGRPKGCLLSHQYELACADWYARLGGLVSIRDGDRLYNPLPLYHINSGVLSFLAMMLTGNCQIQTDRFQPSRWWPEIRQTRATIVHYLGVVVPLLLVQSAHAQDRDHQVRLGIGAGVEPQLHAVFEERFGFPLVEVWGMTEMVRILADCEPPRMVGTRAFGRARPCLDARVVDDQDVEVADGEPGELVVRHSAATPRKGAYSGYLDDAEATANAWRGGWFHTGDIVQRDATGMFHFVDRKKNIIRRSGENIAAAEVEATLQAHPLVKQVAVLAVPDDLREEEVMACVALTSGSPDRGTAEVLFRHCHENLAYYKAPGWMRFMDALPTTGTQKIQKHQIFASGEDPRTQEDVFDLRAMKRR